MGKYTFEITKELMDELIEMSEIQSVVEYDMISQFSVGQAVCFAGVFSILEKLRCAKLLNKNKCYSIEFTYRELESLENIISSLEHMKYEFTKECIDFYYNVLEIYEKESVKMEAAGYTFCWDYFEDIYKKVE